jgi:hypothetical protein
MRPCHHDSTCFLSALRGARNGIYYGAKIRFMHAVVMTILFKTVIFLTSRNPLRKKWLIFYNSLMNMPKIWEFSYFFTNIWFVYRTD